MVMLAVKEQKVVVPQIQESENGDNMVEAQAFCPQCKALQTVWIKSNNLVPTRKFKQIGNQVFHECGSLRPCRIYRSW